MNYKKIKELTIQINQLQKELEKQKQLALKKCKKENLKKLEYNGVIINYYAPNICNKLDTDALKRDDLYSKYLVAYTKNEYVKITIKGVMRNEKRL